MSRVRVCDCADRDPHRPHDPAKPRHTWHVSPEAFTRAFIQRAPAGGASTAGTVSEKARAGKTSRPHRRARRLLRAGRITTNRARTNLLAESCFLCVVSLLTDRCYSSQGFRAIQSVYTTAATRAATWSTAPVYCPFRVNYKVHTQLTLLHYCGYSTVVPSYHTPTLLVHMD